MGILELLLVGVLYVVFSVLSTRWYGKKLDKLEDEVTRSHNLEFNFGKVLTWLGLCLFFWPIVLSYEKITDFRQWRLPHCIPDCIGE